MQAFFPTFILSDRLDARLRKPTQFSLKRFNRELLEQCYLVRDTDDEGAEWSETHYPHGYTSYGSITDLHKRFPHFEELRTHLDRHVKKFARHLDWDLGSGRLCMVSCWVNIMPTNTVHSLHLHPLSVVSGTYYVDVPKDAPSIKFEDPRLERMMAAPPRRSDAKISNQPFAHLKPQAGQFAMWESWLRHEVASNRSSKDRVSISFNYDWV